MFRIFVLCVVFGSGFGLPHEVVKTLTVDNGGVWGNWHPPEFCPAGHFANGYTMKIEPRQGSADDTSLNSVILRCSKNGKYGGQISSGEGDWGSWRRWSNCRPGDFITSFALQVEPSMGAGDDSAANFIKFKCSDLPANNATYSMFLQPGVGFWGSYSQWSESCPANTAVCGIQTRIEPHQGGGHPLWNDDSALNDVKLFCCSYNYA